MPVVKFDVSASDPEAAISGGDPPKPGVYPAIVKECTMGYSKDKNGKPDKSRPRLAVTYKITGPKFKGAHLWEYISFGESSVWKLDQFLQAVGLADKKKRKGQFKTEAVEGKKVRVLVKAGKDLNGDYKADVGRVMPPKGDEEEEEEDVEVEETEEEEVADTDDELVEDDDDEELIEDDDEDSHFTAEQLKAMDPGELKAVAKELKLNIKAKKKSEVISMILATQSGEGEDTDDEDVPF